MARTTNSGYQYIKNEWQKCEKVAEKKKMQLNVVIRNLELTYNFRITLFSWALPKIPIIISLWLSQEF